MDKKKLIGERVREIRKIKKMTQEQLSLKSGIDRTFLAHIEAGSRNISLGTMESIFIGLDVSFKYFFNSKQFS